jgi:hypothetical protein
MATFVSDITEPVPALPETIQCPLCLGEGELTRAEVLDRLGVRDLARVAQLSAEETMRLLLEKEKDAEQNRWAKFEVELTRRVAEVTQKYQAEVRKLETEKDQVCVRLKEFEKNSATMVANAKKESKLETEGELREKLQNLNGRIADLEAAQKLAEEQKTLEVTKVRTELQSAVTSEKARANDLDRRVNEYLGEVDKLTKRNQELEIEMSKVARQGKREEIDFAEDVHAWPGIWISDKLSRHGDYLMAFRDGAGHPLEPRMVVDNKDKSAVTEPDIKKLIRDCTEHKLPVGVVVTRDEFQLRQSDRECRWAQEDDVWLLRTTRAWLQRDLEVLKPIFERMRVEGADFLQKNAALAEEVRHTFVDLDEIEAELKKAGKAVEKAKTATASYRTRLAGLCDTASARKKMPAGTGDVQGTGLATGD